MSIEIINVFTIYFLQGAKKRSVTSKYSFVKFLPRTHCLAPRKTLDNLTTGQRGNENFCLLVVLRILGSGYFPTCPRILLLSAIKDRNMLERILRPFNKNYEGYKNKYAWSMPYPFFVKTASGWRNKVCLTCMDAHLKERTSNVINVYRHMHVLSKTLLQYTSYVILRDLVAWRHKNCVIACLFWIAH